jgi:hypothetical protein
MEPIIVGIVIVVPIGAFIFWLLRNYGDTTIH